MELARVVPIAAAVPIAELLDTIRAATGHQGEAQQIAAGLEWRQVHDYSKVHVSVIPSARSAVLRVGGEYKWRLVVLAATVVPIGAIAGGALGVALSTGESTAVAIGLAVAGAGMAALAGGGVWARMMRRAGSQLADTLTRLQQGVTSASKQPPPSGDGAA